MMVMLMRTIMMPIIMNLSASDAIESRCFRVSASLRKHRMFSPSRYLMMMLITLMVMMLMLTMIMSMMVVDYGWYAYLQISAPLATGSKRKSPLPMLVSRTSYLT